MTIESAAAESPAAAPAEAAALPESPPLMTTEDKFNKFEELMSAAGMREDDDEAPEPEAAEQEAASDITAVESEADNATEAEADSGGGDETDVAPATTERTLADQEVYERNAQALLYAGYKPEEIADLSDEQIVRLGSRALLKDENYNRLKNDPARTGESTEKDGDKATATAEFDLDKVFAPVVDAIGDEEGGVLKEALKGVTEHFEARLAAVAQESEVASAGRVAVLQQMGRLQGKFPELQGDMKLVDTVIAKAKTLNRVAQEDGQEVDAVTLFDQAALLAGLTPGKGAKNPSHTIRKAQPNPPDTKAAKPALTLKEWQMRFMSERMKPGVDADAARKRAGPKPKAE